MPINFIYVQDRGNAIELDQTAPLTHLNIDYPRTAKHTLRDEPRASDGGFQGGVASWPYGGPMIGRMTAVLLLLVPFVASAQAASLTLGCSGTVTTTQIPKAGVANDPTKEKITDFSIVVDFEHRTVSGFWADLNGVHTPLPITSVDANSVGFSASKRLGGISNSINGSVDRITGAVEAIDNSLWQNNSSTMTVFDLHCKPTKPLF